MDKIDEYIANQDQETGLIVTSLRDIVISCAVQIQESIKYKIPFYTFHSNICYINVRKRIVDIGFVLGAQLSDHHGVLEKKDRRSVRTISFQDVSEIDELIIKELVYEAIMLDQSKHSKKQNNKP